MEAYSVRHCIIQLDLTGCSVITPYIHVDISCGRLADDGTGHVHGGVSGSDDSHVFTEMVDLRTCQIVNGVMHVSKGFALDTQSVRTPYSGTYEYALITVLKQSIDSYCSADGGVWPYADPQPFHLEMIFVYDGLRKPEGRYTVS